MDKIIELQLCADEAYLKTEEASKERIESIDKLLESSIGLNMLINFLNLKIDRAIKKGRFQVEIEPEDFQGFSAPIDILIDTSIIVCSKQNYRARILTNGNLLISWKSPAEITVDLKIEPSKRFIFNKPNELK